MSEPVNEHVSKRAMFRQSMLTGLTLGAIGFVPLIVLSAIGWTIAGVGGLVFGACLGVTISIAWTAIVFAKDLGALLAGRRHTPL